MSGLPEYYASTLDLPFNRACLDSQFVLESPTDDPGGTGYGLLLLGNMLLAKKTAEGITLPYGEWGEHLSLYLGRNLQQIGYTNISIFYGGWREWQKYGLGEERREPCEG